MRWPQGLGGHPEKQECGAGDEGTGWGARGGSGSCQGTRGRWQSRWERLYGAVRGATKKAKRSTWKKKCLLRGAQFLVFSFFFFLRERWEKKGKNPVRVCVLVMIHMDFEIAPPPRAELCSSC